LRFIAQVDVTPVGPNEVACEWPSNWAEEPTPRVRLQFVDCVLCLSLPLVQTLAMGPFLFSDEIPADDTERGGGVIAPPGATRVELAGRTVAEVVEKRLEPFNERSTPLDFANLFVRLFVEYRLLDCRGFSCDIRKVTECKRH
ncbi:hypothetical protein, partial [Haloferax sp. Atlit-105R]|uniref:hypothetical protein n=1 Tax=Haloferax sp. Atlit-105R TaxID=2282133 RepID=UPI001314074F